MRKFILKGLKLNACPTILHMGLVEINSLWRRSQFHHHQPQTEWNLKSPHKVQRQSWRVWAPGSSPSASRLFCFTADSLILNCHHGGVRPAALRPNVTTLRPNVTTSVSLPSVPVSRVNEGIPPQCSHIRGGWWSTDGQDRPTTSLLCKHKNNIWALEARHQM